MHFLKHALEYISESLVREDYSEIATVYVLLTFYH